jgi:hypothetical protein
LVVIHEKVGSVKATYSFRSKVTLVREAIWI